MVKASAVKDAGRNGEYPLMPEHSETTHIAYIKQQTWPYTVPDSVVSGLRTVAEFAASHRLRNDTWIVTTITEQGSREDWRVQVTKDVTR